MSDSPAFPAPRSPDRIELGSAPVEGGCASKDTMRAAAEQAGKGEVLARYAADYPAGPHEKPQPAAPSTGQIRWNTSPEPGRRSIFL